MHLAQAAGVPSHRRSLLLPALAWLAFFVACALVTAARAADVSLRWEPVDARGARGTAFALAAAGDWLAVATEAGVSWGRRGTTLRTTSLRGVVVDVAFENLEAGDAPGLLAATTQGFFRIAPDGSLESLSLGPGSAARTVVRIAVAGGFVAVATGDGLFVSLDLRRWQRLALPSGGASAVALRRMAGGVACWTAIRGQLWRAVLSAAGADAGSLVASPPVRVPLPFGAGEPAAVDIALDVAGVDVAVAFDAAIAVRLEPGAPAVDWELLRPGLPPGARLRRVGSGLGRVWLATDRGLLSAPSFRGPWQRVPDAPGSTPVWDLAAAPGVLYAATERGLQVGRLVATTTRRVAGVAASMAEPIVAADEASTDPDVQRVHRAALDYLQLQPSLVADLRRGLARSGWLPVVGFRAIRDTGRSRTQDYDEAYLSGGVRRLYDSDEDRSRDFELYLSLTWDLPTTQYHPEAIDVSREAREIIELRDDVLDEITQLYFERRRVLAELSAIGDATADTARLRRRADELAAGIDAWTGGWFSRAVQAVHTGRAPTPTP